MSKDSSFCTANISLLSLSVLFGTYALYIHNNLLPYIYFIFAICVIIGSKRYGKLDGSLLVALWILLALFPLPFLLYYQDLLVAAAYIVIFWFWFVINSGTDCEKCDSEWCSIGSSKK
jgi:uncharacterized membrane protein YoaK (UPF0700 family)